MNPPSNSPASEQPAPLAPDEPVDPLVESYRRLADVFHEVLSEQSLDDLLERIARTVGELIPYDDITFYEADEGKRELRAVYASGDDSEKVLADEPFSYGVGITGWAVEHREPVLANRAELDPRVRFVANTTPDPESLIVVPLVARGRLKGTLNIYRAGYQEFTEDEFLLVVRFADAAALAIDNAHIRASLELQAQTDPLTGLWNHRAFHERVRQELLTVSTDQTPVALVMLDLDDFKRVNDVYSHATGDHILAEVASILRSAVRSSDIVCRIGGEEFAIIAPASGLVDAFRLAERVQEHVSATEFGPVGPVSLSIGIASGPSHAANPRELVACAEVAMMTAKARGKGQIVVFQEGTPERPADRLDARGAEFRSLAPLKMLHGVSSKLSRLNDVAEIGATIADELRLLIDYHNCRVFVREGDDLRPIAFRGDLAAAGSAMEVLATRVGDGVTGHVAKTGETFLTGDAANCEIGVRIPGTDEIEESLLAVPFLYGQTVVGVIVVSKLGLDQFDADDLRLLEVLAGHVSVALVNARLYEAQRREAESAKALLELTRELSAVTNLAGVLSQVVQSTARIMGSRRCSVWLPTADGGLLCRATEGDSAYASLQGRTLGPELVARCSDRTPPFVVSAAEAVLVARALGARDLATPHAVSFIPLDQGLAALAVEIDSDLAGKELELLDGIASQARLAITNAGSFATLERTFLSTVEALANALEAKDSYTSSHTRWICDSAIDVGRELGLDPQRLKRLELGALFHDIGKIGIPASILMKPGPLTHEERALIQRHPELGERILAPIDQLAEVRPIVRACHERFDGSGYPDGRAADDIPLEARIIFACDAFHAMTTDRPYREALPVEEAFRRLREAAGTQFDPRVVEVCARVLKQPPAVEG
ncbi:MAG TPA: diguanylate cyclase [Gaiella sp.]|nr:diguanylate cyclase [Gaiella sp.]